ncbi:MAG: hypothetical protein ACK2UB_09650 [Anaerolineales bacterium]|jgi:hypothetical protein
MEWKITLHDEPQYVEVATSGVADKEGSMNMAKELIGVMRKNKTTKALIDQRKIEKFVGENVDIHKRPQMMKFLGALLNIRIAEIIKPELREPFEYLEIVFQSQGFKFQLFQEREKAEQWLFG